MEKIESEYFYYGIILLSFLNLLIITYCAFNFLGCWSDEIFSLRLIQLPIGNMFSEILLDVHPPLYYFILRVAVEIAELFNYHNIILIGRIISLIPLYLLFITGLTKVRKNFGLKIASLFTFFIVSMPQLMTFSLEIRMYSWTILFLTLSFIYYYEILKESDYKKWAILTILTIASAYTHYFSAIASFCIYLMLFIHYLKNRKFLKEIILSALVVVIAYIPWIISLINQVTVVSKNYWIKPIDVYAAADTFFFIFSPEFIKSSNTPALQFQVIPILLSAISLIIIIYLIINYYKSDHDFQGNFSIQGLIIFILIPILGFTISNIYRPIFIERYMIPVFGIFWLSVSILISKVRNKKIFILIIAIFLIIGCLTTINGMESQEDRFNITSTENTILNNIIGSNYTIVADDYMGYINFDTFFLPNNHYIIVSNETNHNGTVTKQGNIIIDKNITEVLKEYKNVYYIDFYQDNPIDFGEEVYSTYIGSYKAYTIYKIN